MSDYIPIQNPEEIVLKEDQNDIQKILGFPPGWALRWGITAIAIAMLGFLVLAWLVRYPDIIQARVLILTENPPIRVFSRSSGKINELLVADKDQVKKGQLLAVIENPANLSQVDSLEQLLKRLKQNPSPESWVNSDLAPLHELGSLQTTYAALEQAVNDYAFSVKQQGIFTQINSLKAQIQHLKALNLSLEQQQKTYAREVEIAKKDYDRNKKLIATKAISESELDQSESFYLQTRRQAESLQSQVLNNQIQIEQLNSSIIDLRENRSNLEMGKWLLVQELFERMGSELEAWKQQFLLLSPIDGQLSLTRFWSPQQYVQVNEEVATVVPDQGPRQIMGKASLPVQNSGKVQPGMEVNIQLDSYPFQEFGVIKAQVGSMSLVPDEDNYILEISLADSLITTYNRHIPFAQELQGNARIITEDRRILERVFDQLMNLLKNN